MRSMKESDRVRGADCAGRAVFDLSRTAALLGEERCERLSSARVVVVGVGGVGGWCAEALVRTGIGGLTLVDDDVVVPSNSNRQCAATVSALGRPKVEAMRDRLLAINPECGVEAVCARWPEGVPSGFRIGGFDCVVDAIDSVAAKADLLLAATEAGVPVVSSMGAALRLDPTKVVVREFAKVSGDGLARALRRRFKALGRFPAARIACVCSTEQPAVPRVRGEKGSVMPVVCAFGMALAAQVLARLDFGQRIVV